MTIEIMETGTPDDVYTHREERLGEGNDFEVFRFDENWVVKYPLNYGNVGRPYDNMSEDYFDTLSKDHIRLQGILGDLMPESFFYPPNDDLGFNYRVIQEYFSPEELLSTLTPEEFDNFVRENKEHFADLVNKAEMVDETFGVPLDITRHNLALRDGSLLFIENDSPTTRFEHQNELSDKIQKDRAHLEHIKSLCE